METALKQLISFDSPAGVDSTLDDKGVYVKGFASVLIEDRAGDQVAPEAFQVDRFMASPTVLVNHKYWRDPQGNDVSVGKVFELYPAILRDIGMEDMWGVIETPSSKAKFTQGDTLRENMIPKAIVPDLGPGDRGLFTVVHVTQPQIMKKVQAGEFSAFSWMGLASARMLRRRDGSTKRIFTDVDLSEISLVNEPANPSATFVIGKSVDGETLDVQCLELCTKRFETEEQAVAYLKERGFVCNVTKTDAGYVCPQIDCMSGELSKIKLSQGVYVYAGPHNPSNLHQSAAWEVEETVDGSQILNLTNQQENVMSKSADAAQAVNIRVSLDQLEVAKCDCTKEDTEVVTEAKSEVKPEATLKNELDAIIGEFEGLKEGFGANQKEFADFRQTLTDILAKVEANSVKPEVEEKADHAPCSCGGGKCGNSEVTKDADEGQEAEKVDSETEVLVKGEDAPVEDAVAEDEDLVAAEVGATPDYSEQIALSLKALADRIESQEDMITQFQTVSSETFLALATKIEEIEKVQKSMKSTVVSKSISREERVARPAVKSSGIPSLDDVFAHIQRGVVG